MDRYFVYRNGALGDTLLTLPALDALRNRYPEAEIVLAAHPGYSAPLLDAGRVDTIIDAGSPPFHLLHQTPASEPDELDQLLARFTGGALFTRDPDGALGKRLSGRTSETWALASPFPPDDAEIHIADWMRKNLGPLDINTPPSIPLPLVPSAASRAKAHRLLSDISLQNARIVGIHPGGGGRAKWPPPEVLRQTAKHLCQTFEATPLLIQGPADQEAIDSFLACWGDSLPIFQTPELEVLMAALGQMNTFLGGDSGVSHLAALANVPTLALLGPASNPAQWAPIGKQASWIGWDQSEFGVETLKEIIRKER